MDTKIAKFIFPPDVSPFIHSLWMACTERRRTIRKWEEVATEQWPQDMLDDNKALQKKIIDHRADVERLFYKHLDFGNIENLFTKPKTKAWYHWPFFRP